jgi:hypothetical protein
LSCREANLGAKSSGGNIPMIEFARRICAIAPQSPPFSLRPSRAGSRQCQDSWLDSWLALSGAPILYLRICVRATGRVFACD